MPLPTGIRAGPLPDRSVTDWNLSLPRRSLRIPARYEDSLRSLRPQNLDLYVRLLDFPAGKKGRMPRESACKSGG
jgi:hypothetical protein